MATKKKSASKQAEKQRAQIMAQARSKGTQSLSSNQLSKLTPGQKKKLGIGVRSDDIYRNPNPVTNMPTGTPGKVVQTPDGPRIVPDTDPRPDLYPTTTAVSKPDLNYIPEDAQFALDKAARDRALAASLANYTASEEALASDYGFNFGRYANDVKDARGFTVGYKDDVDFNTISLPKATYDPDRGFDTANPFSRASRLNEAFTTNRKFARNSYANRGLINSGAYGRQQYRDASSYQGGISALQSEFAQRLGEFRNQRSQARSDYDTGNLDDRRQLIQRALQQYQLNNPSA